MVLYAAAQNSEYEPYLRDRHRPCTTGAPAATKSAEDMIVGFIDDGNSEKSDMGFAVFQSEDRRYKLLDYHVYTDAAVIEIRSPTDSKAYNGIYLAEDPAVCNASGKADVGAAYDVILSNNERLSAITRVVDGKQEVTNTVDGNPSMTVFRRSNADDEQEISYQFEISGLFLKLVGPYPK